MWIHFYHIFFPIFPFFVKISLREIYLVELPSSPRNVIESQLVQLRTFLLSNFPFLSRFTGIRGEKIWPRATRRGSRKGGIARENQPKIRGDAQTREREARPLPKGCVAAWLLSAETLRAEVAFNPRLSDSQPPNGVAADSEMQPPLFCLLFSPLLPPTLDSFYSK